MKIIPFLLLTLPIFSQAPEAPPAPKYFVLGGAGYNSGAVGTKVGGLTSFGFKMTSTTWSYTTQQSAALGSSTRTGLATELLNKGNFLVLGLVDAGMASSGTSTTGAFSGGVLAAYHLDKLLKMPGVFAGFDGRLLKANALSPLSKPTYTFVFGKAF